MAVCAINFPHICAIKTCIPESLCTRLCFFLAIIVGGTLFNSDSESKLAVSSAGVTAVGLPTHNIVMEVLGFNGPVTESNSKLSAS